ncbi:membrane dipeptidase [Comamonadaceae bacterium G21597-S1]|nr:membrane dipeptidase [Comamonadaceae bacterium G21597-S1]
MRTWSRRRVFSGLGVAAAAVGAGVYWAVRPTPAPIGFPIAPDELAAARQLLARHPAVDAHAHPGRSFVDGAQNLSGLVWIYARLGSFEDDTVADMRAGGLAAAAFAAVADFQALGLQGEGLAAVRAFEPGEAWASYRRQIDRLKGLASRGLVFPVKTVADVAAARAAGKVGALLTVEGGDFLEGRVDRVALAHADGVRSITLMHYRNNELGDIITGEPVHQGLTAAGRAVVREMNRLGMLVDVAHASEATALGALDASSQPVIASHVHVHGKTAHPRFISPDLMRAVVSKGGGLVGAWPAGIAIVDLRGFVERALELVELAGIDHVCLGTDMDANYKPVFDTYAHLPHFVAGLAQRGLAEGDIAKLIGGNYLRLLAAVQSAGA